MPEILTESFCERCGTRYTFESAAPRAARLKGLKVVSRGLKNFVMSDDSSLDEAMAAARSDTDREVTAQQLDAFHKTFNFCMSCRQYTCANCWNETEGRCLSCAPHLGHEIMPAPFPNLDPAQLAADGNGNGHDLADHGTNGHAAGAAAALAWPTSDMLPDDEPTMDAPADDIPVVDAVARLAALDAVVADEPIETTADEPAAEVAAEEPIDMAADEPAAEVAAAEVGAADHIADAVPEPMAVADPAPAVVEPPVAAIDADVSPIDAAAAAATAQTTDLLHRFRPGQSLDEAIEAFERDRIAAEEAAALATVAAASAAEPDDADAAPADLPEPVAPTAEARPADDIVQPTWQIVAPETPAPDDAPVVPSQPVVPPAPSAEPQWPTTPQWPSHQAAGMPLMGRPAADSLETLWAESAREVATVAAVPAAGLAKTGVQPCVSCGLSLSATARFCRRCGTRQG